MLGNTICEKDLGIATNHKVNTSQQCGAVAKKATTISAYITRTIISRSKYVEVLIFTMKTRLCSILGIQFRKDDTELVREE